MTVDLCEITAVMSIVGFQTAWDMPAMRMTARTSCVRRISALVINTINSVEQFTDEPFETDADEDDGEIRLRIYFRVNWSTNARRIAGVIAVTGAWLERNSRGLMRNDYIDY